MYFWVHCLVHWCDLGVFTSFYEKLLSCSRTTFLVLPIWVGIRSHMTHATHYVHVSPILDQSAWGKMNAWFAREKKFPNFFFLLTLLVPFWAK